MRTTAKKKRKTKRKETNGEIVGKGWNKEGA